MSCFFLLFWCSSLAVWYSISIFSMSLFVIFTYHALIKVINQQCTYDHEFTGLNDYHGLIIIRCTLVNWYVLTCRPFDVHNPYSLLECLFGWLFLYVWFSPRLGDGWSTNIVQGLNHQPTMIINHCNQLVHQLVTTIFNHGYHHQAAVDNGCPLVVGIPSLSHSGPRARCRNPQVASGRGQFAVAVERAAKAVATHRG